MGIFGDVLGGVASIGSSIFGGIAASKAMKKVKGDLENRKKENQNWYDQRYNEDATQRADAQRMLTQTQEAIRQRNRSTAGAQAVMGGTEESVAAAKMANNAALADATAQIAVNADRRKDQIEQTYQQRDGAIRDKLNEMEVNRAKAISEAAQGAAEGLSGIAGSFDKTA